MKPPAPGSPAEARRFAELQEHLRPLFRRVFNDWLAPKTVVVLPSLSLDRDTLAKIDGVAHYEERLLCLLLLLRMPRARVIYLTSMPVHPTIVDYYLHLLAGIPHSHARKRLTLISCHDPSSTPLSAKLLQSPPMLRRLRTAVGDPAIAHLACFNASPLERTVAVRLRVPLYGCDPALSHLGSKSGGRQIFRAAGVRMPDGYEQLRDAQDLAGALAALRRRHPTLTRAVVKLNDGFSGEGNASFRFRRGDTGPDLEQRVARALPKRLEFEARGETWPRYRAKLEAMGGIAEIFVSGDEVSSPSVQCRIDPLGKIEIVSTHEQVLGGPAGQVFLGCEFPARRAYRARLHTIAKRVAVALREHGVLGRFGVDFVSVRRGSRWSHFAIEINLRKGGTTHPFLMLDFLTGGTYRPSTGRYETPTGQVRVYLATDNLQQPRYVGLTPDDLIEIAVEQQMHFDQRTQEGVVFHLIGALERYGKLGLMAIGATRERAHRTYRRAIDVLDDLGAQRARRNRRRD